MMRRRPLDAHRQVAAPEGIRAEAQSEPGGPRILGGLQAEGAREDAARALPAPATTQRGDCVKLLCAGMLGVAMQSSTSL